MSKKSDIEKQPAKEEDPLLGDAIFDDGGTTPPFLEDCWDIIKLGFPIFLAMVSWAGVSQYRRRFDVISV